MKRKITTITLLALAIIILTGGCYTQIKLTKTTAKSAAQWEDRNCFDRRHHNPCYWCSSWNYYYYYPWWLDQIYWWEHYSDEPEDEIEIRRERTQRRRGLGDTMDAIIRGFDSLDDDGDDVPDRENPGDGDNGSDDDTDNEQNRPARRRGIE